MVIKDFFSQPQPILVYIQNFKRVYWLNNFPVYKLFLIICLAEQTRITVRGLEVNSIEGNLNNNLRLKQKDQWKCLQQRKDSKAAVGFNDCSLSAVGKLQRKLTLLQWEGFLQPFPSVFLPSGKWTLPLPTASLTSAGCWTIYKHVETSKGWTGRKGHRQTFCGRLKWQDWQKYNSRSLCFAEMFLNEKG